MTAESNICADRVLSRSRAAQAQWKDTPLRVRLQIVREWRHLIAANALRFTQSISSELVRTKAGTLSSEVLPLTDAARFLEENAKVILRDRMLNAKGRPFFFKRVAVRHCYDPHGVVLIIGPANYPLFLPGVQAMQALVAGNAVLLKPGRNGSVVAQLLANLASEAGLPSGLLTVLDESVETATALIREGVDKIFLTGSGASGRAVLRLAAETLTPCVVELSGDDPFFVLRGAGIARAAAAAAFALKLNGGNTCIAPRRFFVARAEHSRFGQALAEQLNPLSRPPLTPVDSDDEALALAADNPHALGATVFGPEPAASQFARRVTAGIVVVNDVIVPTADPRVTFGGRRASGFGKTRGAEGLLEMVVLKAIVTQNSKRLRHLDPPHPRAKQLFQAYITLMHGKQLRTRYSAIRRIFQIAMDKSGSLDD